MRIDLGAEKLEFRHQAVLLQFDLLTLLAQPISGDLKYRGCTCNEKAGQKIDL